MKSRQNAAESELEVRSPPVVSLVIPRLLEMILCDDPARDVLVRLCLLREPQLPTERLIRSHDEGAFFPSQKVESIYIHENNHTQCPAEPALFELYSTSHPPGIRNTVDLQAACPRQLLFMYSTRLYLRGSGDTPGASQESACLPAALACVDGDRSGPGCSFYGAPFRRRSDALGSMPSTR